MNKRCIFILITFSCLSKVSAQERVYVNEGLFEVDEASAVFTRLIHWDSLLENSVLVEKYSIDGILLEKGYYSKPDLRTKNGSFIEYFPTGPIRYNKNFKNNQLHGNLTGFFENQQLRREDNYDEGIFGEGKCYTIDGADTTHYPMYVEPTFIGENHSDVYSFISENMEYPMPARLRGIRGTVIVNFWVGKDGSVYNVKVSNADSEFFNDESIRLLSITSKLWSPGYFEGKKANTSLELTLTYELR